MSQSYVHGYGSRESERLRDQAQTLEELLHAGVAFPPGAAVLEAACGVGAQTVPLARNSPGTRFTAVDISLSNLREAQARVAAAALTNVEFKQADVLALPFAPESFDHVFVCFLLEHLERPEAALARLRHVLRPGGTITVIEGDHGSALFHPQHDAAEEAISCQVELQRRAGGDALIGRKLRPLLVRAGFGSVSISPRLVHADSGSPELVEGFIRRTFTAMIEGVRETAINTCLIAPERFDAGIEALRRTTEPDGSFCYTFFKAMGRKD